MKAALLEQVNGPFRIADVKISDPLDHEVLIDVQASGLCHSDQHVATVETGFPLPLLLGHEVAGVVAAVGSRVYGLQVGDHVVTAPIHHCGRCRACFRGRPYQCADKRYTERPESATPRLTLEGEPLTAFQGVGGFAEQILAHENIVVKVPKEIPFDSACLLGCGVVTGAGAAINSARVRPGDTVTIIGCGGVGLNTVQAAALSGAERIVAVDMQEAKLKLAKTFGATDVINPQKTDAVQAIQELTGGVTHAFEFVGNKVTSEQAVAMLEPGGTAYLVGVHKPGATIEITPFGDLMGKQKGIRGVAMGSSNPKIDIPRYADLYLQGRFKLDELVSRRVGLGDIAQSYADMADGGVARNVITTFRADRP